MVKMALAAMSHPITRISLTLVVFILAHASKYRSRCIDHTISSGSDKLIRMRH
jgi:hypothetical protein